MNDEEKVRARSDDWRLRWTSRGILVLTIAALLASRSLLRNQPIELRLTLGMLAPLCVFFGSWSLAWLCGIRPFGG